MTIQEAIYHLHTFSSTNGSGQTTQKQHEEAKEMAIKALASIEQIIKERDEARNALVRLSFSPFFSEWLQEYTNKAQNAQPNLRPTCDKLAIDCISRQEAINAIVKRTCLPWELLKIIYPMLCVLETLPSAQPEPRWIPCNERMPEATDYYLIQYSRRICQDEMAVAFYSVEEAELDKNYTWEFKPFADLKEVIAWMLLPKPYKEEGKNATD